MLVPARLIGDPGRLPFPGHLRCVWSTRVGGITLAGRVGAGSGGRASVEPAYLAARALQGAFAGAFDGSGARRHDLLRQAWSTLIDLDCASLGSEEGRDLTLLLVARDAAGVSVAAVGLGAIWALAGGRLWPLANAGHPLLAPAGRPAAVPGALSLQGVPDAVIGLPAHLPTLEPDVNTLDLLCGVHP